MMRRSVSRLMVGGAAALFLFWGACITERLAEPQGFDSTAPSGEVPGTDVSPTTGGGESPTSEAPPSPLATPDTPLENFAGPREEIEILIDDQDVPHIYATNDLDLFWAQGYWIASEWLFEVDTAVRAATGRSAEVFGEDAEGQDIQAYTFDFPGLGLRAMEAVRSEFVEGYNLALAYLAGLNARIEEILAGDAPVPPEFEAFDYLPEPFFMEEVFAHAMRIQFGFSSTLEFDLLASFVGITNVPDDFPLFEMVDSTFIMETGEVAKRAGPGQSGARAPLPMRSPALAVERIEELNPVEVRALMRALRQFRLDLNVGEGSNAFVIHGDHTFNGRPIFQNDSHSGIFDRNRQYFWHLNSRERGEGTFNTIGWSFVGVPGIQIGHNERMVWGATTNFADQTDIFAVRRQQDRIFLGDERPELDVRDETYRVRLEDGSFEERSLVVRRLGDVGVMIPSSMLPVPLGLVAPQRQLLLKWPGFGLDNTELRLFLTMERAETIDGFREAIRYGTTGMQNWKAATADDMGYQTSGLVPDRGPAEDRPDAARILDGFDERALWTGEYLAPEQLPALDGERDYILSANNDPWGFTEDNNPLNGEFYYGSWFAPGARAAFLARELDARIPEGGITAEEAWALGADTRSLMQERMMGLLAEIEEAVAGDAELEALWENARVERARALFADWDGTFTRELEAPALYRIWVAKLQQRALVPLLTDLIFPAIDGAQPVMLVKYLYIGLRDERADWFGGSIPVALLETLRDAEREWQERDQPTWGELHVLRIRRTDRSSYDRPVDGVDDAPNVSQCRFFDDGAELGEVCVVQDGAVLRNVTTFDEDGVPRMWFNHPGNSALQWEHWFAAQPQPAWFRRAEVEAAQMERIVWEPRAPLAE